MNVITLVHSIFNIIFNSYLKFIKSKFDIFIDFEIEIFRNKISMKN